MTKHLRAFHQASAFRVLTPHSNIVHLNTLKAFEFPGLELSRLGKSDYLALSVVWTRPG